MARMSNAKVEDAGLLYPNFAGRKDDFNAEGKRNFVLHIDEPTALAMKADGWNVKKQEAKEEGASDRYIMKVNVNFEGRFPPSIWIVTSRGKAQIPADLVFMLDAMDVSHIDVILNPYQYTVRGDSGVSAYLKTAYLTLQENELDEKYRDVKEINLDGSEVRALTAGNDENQTPGMHDILEGEILAEWEDPEPMRELMP